MKSKSSDEEEEGGDLLASLSPEEAETLRDICITNGVNIERLEKDAPNQRLLEMFFHGMPVMQALHVFPNLTELVIMSQEVARIEGLHACPSLQRLWVCECRLEEISGLEHCRQLRQLYLYSNKLTRISGLERQALLERLWLNKNQISQIEGIAHMVLLEELNLSGNLISELGESLDANRTLVRLYLSGNRLSSFKDLIGLVRLPNLRVLSLKEAQYGPNPACLLSNYAVYLLYHLPLLERLDSFQLGRQAREIAESITLKKKMFYLMKSRAIKRSAADTVSKLRSAREDALKLPHERIRTLCSALKYLERVETEGGSEKVGALRECLRSWGDKCARIERLHDDAQRAVHRERQLSLHLQQLELESGGNVKLETGENEQWVRLVGELLTSRFCVQEFRQLGVIGVRAHRVMRLHNRLLWGAYDSRLGEEVEGEEECRRQQEFLFWPWESHEASLCVLEEGFQNDVLLTNSLNIADRERVRRALHDAPLDVDDECPFRTGRVLVCKTFVGRSAGLSAGEEKPPGRALSYHRPQKVDSKLGGGETCDCHARQLEWRLFESRLALPEYLVEFEYVTRTRSSSPFHAILYGGDTGRISHGPDTDTDALSLPPTVRPRSPVASLSDAVLLKLSPNTVNVAAITHLNLHDAGLTRIEPLQRCTSLTSLVLSFNDVVRLDELSGLSLEVLDASFNRLQTLDGLKNMARLRILDLSWNRLHNSREDVSLLRKHAPNVTHLLVHHNPWQKAESLRLRIIGRMKALIKLDEQTVTEAEAAAAMRMAAGSRISQAMMTMYSRTDTTRPRSFSLLPAAQALFLQSGNRVERGSLEDPSWFLRITSLAIDGQHISKISNLERLENLRFASFDNNDITRMEGLAACVLLEELSLEDNCIVRVEGLERLTRLKRLFLASNYISALTGGGMESLSGLQLLAVENNRLSSLRGLERCTALLELYAANNRIADTRELFYLKGLPNLLILDLFGNGLTSSSSHYRPSVIFHLKTLKALDGRPIDSAEATQARELLGGKLTCDFLIERLGHDRFYEMRELDFPSAGIRSVELSPAERFINLRSVNLERNNLSHLSGLVLLSNLKVLCLNYNHVESLLPRPPATQGRAAQQANTGTVSLDNLEVLQLACNGIKDLGPLQLHRLPALRALFLQGNELSVLDGLEGLLYLRELVVDRNKIKGLSENVLSGLPSLREFHLEENRLRGDFSALAPLGGSLERLFLGANRVQDISEVERLEALPNLTEVSLVNNTVARRMMHRPLLIHRLPRLLVIDGVPISEEERDKTELYFSENPPPNPQPPPAPTQEVLLPSIGSYKTSNIKVTNVHLAGDPNGLAAAGDVNPTTVGASPTGIRSRPMLRHPMPTSTGAHRTVINGASAGHMYYYDPTGHVEPLHGRWGTTRNRK